MTARLLLTAPASGGGKTTVTCALLQVLLDRGECPVAFKSGPDYIDPMFHSKVIGAKSRNLDLFLMGESAVRRSLRDNTPERGIAVLEGAMGYYDGIALTSEASAYDLARRTETPAVLIVDGRGAALSAAATVKGFQSLRPDNTLTGVIFNRISPMLYPRMKACVEGETGLPVYGYLPELPGCSLSGGRLGLDAGQIAALREKLAELAAQAEKTLDVEGLLALARRAPDLSGEAQPLPEPVAERPRIAVARDEAFSFYYADALQLLEELGAELIEFSPLADRALPEGSCGLWLGGGSPENYARQLSENTSMRESIRAAVVNGLPTVAEGGGFLYLHRQLGGFPMVGAIPAEAFDRGKLSRFGYVTLIARTGGLLCGPGESLPAHEFHYWDSTDPGRAFRGQKPGSDRGWDCCVHTAALYGGFPQLHLCGCPEAAHRFVAAAVEYGKRVGRCDG